MKTGRETLSFTESLRVLKKGGFELARRSGVSARRSGGAASARKRCGIYSI